MLGNYGLQRAFNIGGGFSHFETLNLTRMGLLELLRDLNA